MPEKASKAVVDRAEFLYRQGMTMAQVGKAIGYCAGVVGQWMRERGVPRRGAHAQHKYKIDETFFDVIDTEMKAWVLGLWAADGCVSATRRGRISFGQDARDRGTVEKVKVAMQATYPVKRFEHRRKTGEVTVNARLDICSAPLADGLASHGVGPRKSTTMVPLTGVPEKLQRHMWRGYCDGDGCLYVPNAHKCAVYVVGTKAVLQAWCDWVRAQGVKTKAEPWAKPGCPHTWQVGMQGKHLALAVAALLYEGATIYMERKMAKYREMRRTIGQ